DDDGKPVHDFRGDPMYFDDYDSALKEKEYLRRRHIDQVPLPRLRGLDLKVGGEGMRGFYDKIVPDYLNKFGKKFGARVEPVKVFRKKGGARAKIKARGRRVAEKQERQERGGDLFAHIDSKKRGGRTATISGDSSKDWAGDTVVRLTDR